MKLITDDGRTFLLTEIPDLDYLVHQQKEPWPFPHHRTVEAPLHITRYKAFIIGGKFYAIKKEVTP